MILSVLLRTTDKSLCGHKYFAEVKVVKKKPEVLAKAKIQLGRSAGR